MSRTVWAIVAIATSGCVQSDAVECGAGRLCPADTVCDDTRSLCLTREQTTACTGLADGQVCNASGTPGICDRSLCEPGCGDGVTDPDEQCDDGNFASHDGCSSRCRVEEPGWTPVPSPWQGAVVEAGGFHAALGRLVIVGGNTADGYRSQIWQRDPAKLSDPSGGWLDVTGAFAADQMPPAQSGAAYAYDPTRNVLVVYGGFDGTSASSDTWEYAASSDMYLGEPVGRWTKRALSTNPGPRQLSAMAYDDALGKIVLFGGNRGDLLAADNETWTYDGTTWTQLSPTASPPARARHGLAYDSSRSKLVMFGGGGFDTKTYEFDGTTWTALTLTPAPGARKTPAMAYAPGSGIVLYGGNIGNSSVAYSDTWVYNGAWTQQALPLDPPGRSGALLTLDPVGGSLVLTGGVTGAGDVYADVWELAAGGWTETTPRFSPPTAANAATAFDLTARAMFVFGGFNLAVSNELWAFDGRTWTSEPSAPVGRYNHGMIYDSARGKFVVFGGCDDTACPVAAANTTYELDPATFNWTPITGSWPASLARRNPALVYDETRHRTVMFGGVDMTNAAVGDTWTYDGTTWTLLAAGSSATPAPTSRPAASWDPVTSSVIALDSAGVTWQLGDTAWTSLVPASAGPGGRHSATMSYDVQRKRFVLIGGEDASNTPLADVWELDTATATWTQVLVPGTGPLPRHDHVAVDHENARAQVLFGGQSGTIQSQGDTWILQYRSTTPDEICGNGIDDDGDGQVDSADPDCTPPPPP